MPNLIDPDEVITAIANMRYAGDTEADIVRIVIRVIEDQARLTLKSHGLAPIYSYNDSQQGGQESHEANQRRELWERMQWLNEAIQIEGCGIYGAEQAAIVLREAEEIRTCIDQNETARATISAFNLLACALLPADTKKALDILRMPAKLQKQRGQNGGKNKAGYLSPIKQYVKRCCDEYLLNELIPKQAAAKIIELFENETEQEPYHDGETCPIVVFKYDRDTKTLDYFEPGKPEKIKQINFDGITRIIRDLRNPKPKKTK